MKINIKIITEKKAKIGLEEITLFKGQENRKTVRERRSNRKFRKRSREV